jgi:hypothetical protein
MEKLRIAILQDCEETLHNPKNRFRKESQHDECCCYNNLHVALRVLKEKDCNVENWFRNIEIHMRDKRCNHIWSNERMNEAVWEYVDSKEST